MFFNWYKICGLYLYTPRSQVFGFYSELVFVDSRALKWAHSRLRNHFSNEAIDKNKLIESPKLDRAEYSVIIDKFVVCMSRIDQVIK